MTMDKGSYEAGIYRMGDVRIMDRSAEKRLPIGYDGFETVADRSLFVDKSLLVADILGGNYPITLFCRPRRFGKTLAMTMLKSFFELPPDGVSRAPLFEGLAVWDAKGGRYRAEQGVRPVIYLSLNDVKKGGWEECYQTLEGKMAAEYQRHAYLADSAALSEDERLQFGRVSGKEGEYDDVASSLRQLALYLFKHHGRRVVILIDEYDAPIMAAYNRGYYRQVECAQLFFKALSARGLLGQHGQQRRGGRHRSLGRRRGPARRLPAATAGRCGMAAPRHERGLSRVGAYGRRPVEHAVYGRLPHHRGYRGPQRPVSPAPPVCSQQRDCARV